MSTNLRRCAALAALLAAACNAPLTDPESPGARLYGARCAGCHRLYAPGTLTAAMWELQMDRMQAEMARRGVRPLDATERDLVLHYLQAHATGAAPAGASE
jgi:mono/diheme cytochrome c family protein